MTGVDGGRLAWLLAVDALNMAGGVGALAALGLVRSRFELLARGGVALLLGMLVGGIVEAHLALVGVPLSLGALAAIDVILVLVGVRAWRRAEVAPDERLPRRASAVLAPIALGFAALQLAHIAATAAVRPLVDWDAWAIWGLKARVLTVFGTAVPGVFDSHQSVAPHLDYPILQPTLEALALRDGWDPGLGRLQVIVLVGAALWAIVGICHGRVPLEAPSLAVAFLVLQQWFVDRLLTGQADVPVAVVSACALVALLRFLLDGDRRVLAVGAICAGGAGLIKNEGALFVLAAFVAVALALLVARRRSDLRPLGLALAGTVAIWAPWRLYVAFHHLPSTDYDLGSALQPTFLDRQFSRVGPSTRALWNQIDLGVPVLLVLAGVAAALLVGRFALALAIATWCVLSFAGLVGIFWISVVGLDWQIATAADRVTTTILVGGIAAAALGAGEALREHVIAGAHPVTRDAPASRGSELDGVTVTPLPSGRKDTKSANV